MRNIWNKIVSWILAIPQGRRLNFGAGLVIAAFFCIALGMKVCIVPAIAAAFLKVFFDMWTTNKCDWWDFAAACIGGLVPQLFVVLNLWWF